MILFIFIGLALVCVFQAYLSSRVNRGEISILFLWVVGLVLSGLWAAMSKYSNNMIRDSLIWDVVAAMVFSLIFIFMGHSVNFTIKHWIGILATFAVFVYWSLIK
jgi:NhaP-type Na+/H+ or K+/H+ antiporter